jgi:hypothetical protein
VNEKLLFVYTEPRKSFLLTETVDYHSYTLPLLPILLISFPVYPLDLSKIYEVQSLKMYFTALGYLYQTSDIGYLRRSRLKALGYASKCKETVPVEDRSQIARKRIGKRTHAQTNNTHFHAKHTHIYKQT